MPKSSTIKSPTIQAKHEKKQKQIYLAALKILAKRGFHNTKMQDVAEKAGLGKGTLYWYFKSKEELFGFVIRSGFEDFNLSVISAINQVNHPLKKLKAAFEESLNFYFTNKDHIWILTSFWSVSGLKKLSNQLMKEVNEEFATYRHIVEGVLANATRLGHINPGNNRKRAAHFMALVDGLMVQRVLGMHTEESDKTEAEVFKEYLKGLQIK